MLNKISTWGTVAVVVYLTLIGLLFVSALNCQGMFCGAGIVVAMLPWIVLFENGLQTPLFELSGMAWFWTTVSINILILYSLFATFQKWIKTGRKN